jgi:hypothetical protein
MLIYYYISKYPVSLIVYQINKQYIIELRVSEVAIIQKKNANDIHKTQYNGTRVSDTIIIVFYSQIL